MVKDDRNLPLWNDTDVVRQVTHIVPVLMAVLVAFQGWSLIEDTGWRVVFLVALAASLLVHLLVPPAWRGRFGAFLLVLYVGLGTWLLRPCM
jgi:hypothetical protein